MCQVQQLSQTESESLDGGGGGWFGETPRETWGCSSVGRVRAWLVPSAGFNPWHYLNPYGPTAVSTGEVEGGGTVVQVHL